MSRFPLLLLLTLCGSLNTVFSQNADQSLFLALEGIRGQATDANHVNWLDVSSFEMEGRVDPDRGTVAFSDLHVEAALDNAATHVLEKLWTGEPIGAGTLERTEAFGARGQLSIETWRTRGTTATHFEREGNERIEYSFAFESGEVCDIDRNAGGGILSQRCSQFVGRGIVEPDEDEETETELDEAGKVFLRVDGVNGPSAELNRRNWIDATSIAFSASRVFDDDDSLGELQTSGLVIAAEFDAATSPIIGLMVANTNVRQIQVERTEPFENAGELLLERWVLRDATVSKVHRNTESVEYTFDFAEVEFCMTDRNDNGSVRSSRCATLVSPVQQVSPLQAGDADEDRKFDQLDLVKVQIASKYLTGQAATWGDGDWNGAPGGAPGSPPAGDGVFNQLDIIAAQLAGVYLTGPYAAVIQAGAVHDHQTSIVYDALTGEVAIDAAAGVELTSINIDSAAGIFTADAARGLGGSFDHDADNNVFKATFGASFGSFSFGNVAQTGLTKQFLLQDLSAVGSRLGGGDLGQVDLVYVPEPSTTALWILGVLLGVAKVHRWDGK